MSVPTTSGTELVCTDGVWVVVGNQVQLATCGPPSCTKGGLIRHSIEHSVTPCTGSTGDTCDYTCEDGYTRSGQHICQPPINGQSDGSFSGGSCTANPCSQGTTVSHSNRAANPCTGSTGDTCDYTCDDGYSRSGQHICQPGGSFSGGSCTANPCSQGTTVSHSNRAANPCTGSTGDTCDYTCDDGYSRSGLHVCATDGTFAGGFCTPLPCQEHSVEHAQQSMVCTGSTGDSCNLACSPGYLVSPTNSDLVCEYSDAAGGVTWTGGTICAPIHCGDLVAPAHGTVRNLVLTVQIS